MSSSARYFQAILLLTIILLAGFLASRSSGLSGYLSELFKDQLIRSQSLEPDPRVVFVEINERALELLGQWPLSRSTWADILERVSVADIVGVDVLFVDRSPVAEDDIRLAETLSALPQVILAFALAREPVRDLSPDEWHDLEDFSSLTHLLLTDQPFPTAPALQLPNPTLLASGSLVGGIWVLEEDSRIRRYPLAVQHNDVFFPSLGLQMLQTGKSAAVLPGLHAQSGEGVRVGDIDIAYDRQGTVRLNFYDPAHYPKIQMADLLDGSESTDALAGKWVILGVSVAGGGVYDMKHTPVGTLAGPLVHATFLQNALGGHFLRESVRYTWVILSVLLLLAGVLTLRPAIWLRLVFYGLVSVLLLWLCFWAIRSHLLLLDGFILVVAWLSLAAALEITFLAFSERRLHQIDKGLIQGGSLSANVTESVDFTDRIYLRIDWIPGAQGCQTPKDLKEELNRLHNQLFEILAGHRFQIVQVGTHSCTAISSEEMACYLHESACSELSQLLEKLYLCCWLPQGDWDVLPQPHPRQIRVVVCGGQSALMHVGPVGGKQTVLGGDVVATAAALSCVTHLLKGAVILLDPTACKLLSNSAQTRLLPLDCNLLSNLGLTQVYEWLPSNARGQLLAGLNALNDDPEQRTTLLKLFAARYLDGTAHSILNGRLNG